MQEEINRVFFHELGHFVVREINQKYFGVMGEVDEIMLFPSGFGGRYHGTTTPKVPEGEKADKPVVSVAEKLAVLVYGCFLESLFLKTDFELCFDIRKSGDKDVREWGSLVGKISDKESLYQHVKDYFETLKDSGCFDEVLELDVKQYLMEIGGGKYLVDLIKLKEAIGKFLLKHEELYLPFIERIREYVSQ